MSCTKLLEQKDVLKALGICACGKPLCNENHSSRDTDRMKQRLRRRLEAKRAVANDCQGCQDPKQPAGRNRRNHNYNAQCIDKQVRDIERGSIIKKKVSQKQLRKPPCVCPVKNVISAENDEIVGNFCARLSQCRLEPGTDRIQLAPCVHTAIINKIKLLEN